LDQQTFTHLFDKAVDLHIRGRTPQALAAVDHLVTLVSDCPELELACRSERASLLYHLGRNDEASRLVKAVIKEQRELSRTSRQRDKGEDQQSCAVMSRRHRV
jgi:hypothetical protein